MRLSGKLPQIKQIFKKFEFFYDPLTIILNKKLGKNTLMNLRDSFCILFFQASPCTSPNFNSLIPWTRDKCLCSFIHGKCTYCLSVTRVCLLRFCLEWVVNTNFTIFYGIKKKLHWMASRWTIQTKIKFRIKWKFKKKIEKICRFNSIPNDPTNNNPFMLSASGSIYASDATQCVDPLKCVSIS